ncbi:putative cytochrome P450 49a1 [Blattella germanica]|nr:putative cytochrome P450 49a1 [Blattella germanica]
MSVRRRLLEELRRTLGPSGKRPHTTSLQPSVTDLVHPGYKHENAAKPYSEVPGPKELPFIGNAWRFLPFIDYGKVVKVGGLVGHPDLVFVFDGDYIEQVFRREEVMPHRPSMPSLRYYKQYLRKQHGPQWDEFRAQVQQVMLQSGAAKKYVGPLNQVADEFLARIELLKDEKKELPENFLGEIYKWALEYSETHRIIKSIHTFFVNVAEVELRFPFWRIWSTPTWNKYIGALDVFRELCMKYITEAMDRMNDADERPFEDRSLVEKIILKTNNPKIAAVLALDLLLVGVDTTSVSVTSSLYQLAKNPEKQDKLFKELESLLPHPESPVDVKTLDKLTYLKACIKETLSNIPENFPQPEKFLPERWIKSEACPAHKIHPFVSLPFGYGRRTCLGRRFAEAELHILLAKIFRKYRVEYHYEDFRYKICPTYIPENTLKFRLVERQ